MAKLDPIYKELAANMKMENSEIMQQIIAKLANLEQARIIREFPASAEEIAVKLNMDKEKVAKDIQELVEKGLVVLTKKGPRMVRTVGQFHDTQTNPKYDKELGDEYFALWRKHVASEANGRLKRASEHKGVPLGRIIPRWKSIKDIPGVLPFEDTREILKNAPVALVHCSCKRINQKKDGIPDECCLCFAGTAEFNVNARKAAKMLTYEEAMAINDSMDKYPVVHLTANTRDLKILLCNCNSDTCDTMKAFKPVDFQYWKNTHAPSRFMATVDPEKCHVCRTCVDNRCQFQATHIKYYPELGRTAAYIDEDKCMGCGICVLTCPTNARVMKLIRPPEHVPATMGNLWAGGAPNPEQ
jgi:NAD-dependent dihydropyrimidine dehydrogenase PreA subunit/biotin operon repressor